MRKTSVHLIALSTVALLLSSCQQNQTSYDYPMAVVDETYMHRYGVPVSPEEWNAGGNHGQIVSTLANGVVIKKSYSSGILDGDTTYSYPHSSSIEKVESYANGILQKQSTFYVSGAPKEEVFFNSPQNRTISTWYETGAPKSKEEYQGNLLYQASYYAQNNQIDSQVNGYVGTRTQRDNYGQLASIDTIDKGLMTLRTTYHQNGTSKEVIPYVNGVVYGQLKTYFPGGEPHTIEEWDNGAQTGLTTEFLNGEKICDCVYVNGQRHGVEHRYRDGNTVVQESYWVNGQKHGPCTSFLGNITKTDWYWQGKQVTKANYDIITGQGKKNIWNNAS